MILYIAGPMAGRPQGNLPAFHAATADLRERGHTVLSPVEMDHGLDDVGTAAADITHPRRGEFLAADLAILVGGEPEAIVFLPGWEGSAGCRLEARVASAIGVTQLTYPGLEAVPVRHPASARFHQLLEGLAELHDMKQQDYGLDNDPFANVRATTAWGMPAWVGSMVRATDKVKRLQTFASTGHLANEGVVDAFADLAVYATIARVLYEEDLGPPDP